VGKINEMKGLIDDSRMKLIMRVNLIICYVCQTLCFNNNPTLLSYLLKPTNHIKKSLDLGDSIIHFLTCIHVQDIKPLFAFMYSSSSLNFFKKNLSSNKQEHNPLALLWYNPLPTKLLFIPWYSLC